MLRSYAELELPSCPSGLFSFAGSLAVSPTSIGFSLQPITTPAS